VQQPCAGQKTELEPVPYLIFPDSKNRLYSSELLPGGTDPEYSVQADFSQRLAGGILRHFEFGLIVVDSAAAPGTLQPTGFTADAIITSSVRSKIASQSQLPPGDFEIQTDDGVVTIRSKDESLDQAAAVINLALCVPDVREIVYTMPSSGWRIVGTWGRGETYRRRISG
jgi:BON domain